MHAFPTSFTTNVTTVLSSPEINVTVVYWIMENVTRKNNALLRLKNVAFDEQLQDSFVFLRYYCHSLSFQNLQNRNKYLQVPITITQLFHMTMLGPSYTDITFVSENHAI